jgi:hypothetical protein
MNKHLRTSRSTYNQKMGTQTEITQVPTLPTGSRLKAKSKAMADQDLNQEKM